MGPQRVRFGPFEFDPETVELRNRTRPVRIQELPLRILAMLLANPGSVVTRDQLRDRLWPPDTFVDFDNSLNTAVNKLRAALGDRAQAPTYIETVGRRGYRFIAPIDAVEVARSQGAGTPSPDVSGGPVSTFPQASRLGVAGWIVVGVALLGTLAVALIPRRSGPAGLTRLRSHHVTSLPGAESAPTLSRDGTHVAFIWRGNLYVQPVNVGAGAEVRIAENAATPAWSPDGQWIAFRRRKTEDTWALMLVTPHGREEREIAALSPPPGGMGKHGFSWSADGQHLATIGPVDGRSGVIVVTTSTGVWTRLTDAAGTGGHRFPAFSPDGTSLAYLRIVSEQSKQEVITHDLATGREKVISVLTGGVPFDLGWLPDSSALLVSIVQDDALTGLWRIGRDGGTPTPVDPSEGASGFSVARLSHAVAYAGLREECDLWETYPDDRGGAGRSRQLPGSERYDWDVQISPDNRHLAFASRRTRLNQIWTSDRDGLKPRQLTRCTTACTTPRWSPDGTRIVYQQHEAGEAGDQFTLYVTNLEGRARRLATGRTPFWSSDSKWVYFASQRTGKVEIWKVGADGGPEMQVTRGGGGRGRETADGWLYYTHPEERALYRMRADGTGRELIHPKLPFLRGPLLLEQGIYFGEPGLPFRYLDYLRQQLVEILRLPEGTSRCFGFDIAGDGAVVHSRSRAEGDIILLDPVR